MLALTADEVVLINGRRGMLRPVATGLCRAFAAQLREAEVRVGKLDRAAAPHVGRRFALELDVPRAEGRKARSLLDRLAPAVLPCDTPPDLTPVAYGRASPPS